MTETYETYEVGELIWVNTSYYTWELAMILSCDDDELRNQLGERFFVMVAGEDKEQLFHCSWFKKCLDTSKQSDNDWHELLHTVNSSCNHHGLASCSEHLWLFW